MESLRDGHNDTIYVCLMIFSLEPSKIRHIGHIEGSLCFEVTRIAFQRGDLYVGPPTPHESIWWTRYLEMMVKALSMLANFIFLCQNKHHMELYTLKI